MNISHLESMAQIHSFLIANAQNELNFVNNETSQDEFTTTFNQIAIVMEKGIDLFEENDSFPIFDENDNNDDDDDDDDNLQLQNENGLNLEIGEIIDLTKEKSDLINRINENNDELRIEHGNKDFNIEELLQGDN